MHLELYNEWAGIADAFLEAAGFGDGPTDVRELAACYDLRVAHGGARGCTCVVEDLIFADLTLPEPRLRADLGHELGHVALELHGYENVHDELAASWVGAALLCPTRAFKRDVKELDWNLDELRLKYGVSWELAARRIVDVRSAIVTVVDRGRISTRIQSPWLHIDWGNSPTAPERELLLQSANQRTHFRPESNHSAWWIPADDGWERTILVASAESLETYSFDSGSAEPLVTSRPA